MEFKISKQNALSKFDKSNEKKWDEKIKPLCDKINFKENYFTTSSCSGRITIVKTTENKIEDAFLFKSHEKVTFVQIKKIVNSIEEVAYFRMEACALHVACKNFDDAIKLLDIARSIGFKKSGIISDKKGRFICEMFSTESISAPINKDISDDYLRLLIKEANKKLEKTQGKIEKLNNLLVFR